MMKDLVDKIIGGKNRYQRIADRGHVHNWYQGYYQRCDACGRVVEGDLEEGESLEDLTTKLRDYSGTYGTCLAVV
jgi:lysozyme family protein